MLGLACTLACQAPAAAAEKFDTRLGSVAFESGGRGAVTGDGRVEAVLDGRNVAISGSFEGLSAPATKARLFSGPAVGVPGRPVFDLAVTPATSGSVSGAIKLNAAQAKAFAAHAFYVQIDTAKAPDGAVWGWLMHSRAFPGQDVPEAGDGSGR